MLIVSKACQSVFGGFLGLSLNFVILPFFMRLRSSRGYDTNDGAPHSRLDAERATARERRLKVIAECLAYTGAHGRTRTSTARIRSPAHCPFLLRAQIGAADGIRTRVSQLEGLVSCLRRRPRIGSGRWIRTTLI